MTTAMMTNRELFTEYETSTGARRFAALAEMSKRIHRTMITSDVVPIFKQYKLNGAGNQRY